MPKNTRYPLIKELKLLYRRIIQLVLKQRETAYQPSVAHAAGSSVLHSLEKNFDAAAVLYKEQKGVDVSHSVFDAEPFSDKPLTPPSRKESNGLSSFFSKKRPATQLRPRISLELERETWKHIHVAMRHAREGDMNNAHLQGQIAVEALNELAHYLPEKHYERFRGEVLDRLEEMQNELERSVIEGSLKSKAS